MRLTLLLAAALAACSTTAHSPAAVPVARLTALDSATVRRLCAKPDSVLARTANCELRDQRQLITVVPNRSVERPYFNF